MRCGWHRSKEIVLDIKVCLVFVPRFYIPLAANSKPTESWLLFTSSEIIIERLSRSPTKIEDISEHLRNRSKRIERVGLGTRNRTRTRTSTSRYEWCEY